MVEQLVAIFAFGLLITGIVFLGLVRAREVAERQERVAAAANDSNRDS